MALLQDLIKQISNPVLRNRIMQETNKLMKQKKFGLVFEEHLPECTLLYDVPVKVGVKVALKTGYVSDIYTVLKIDDTGALCDRRENHEQKVFSLDDLVVVVEFGEPIYPTLQMLDSVENAPDSDLWHTLIEADNYHALQLLAYLYAEKVDCIYIDPPYNTGAKDWKYNNDYVDSNDQYRHSKWLSMMEKRLKLAKKLLNPKDSVLIVTIDEKEYLHLGCLLEEMFPDATIQMISSKISRKGAVRYNLFTRTNEFVYFVMLGNYNILSTVEVGYTAKGEPVHWQPLRRSSIKNIRNSRPRQFYPIYVDYKTNKIIKIGDYIAYDVNRFSVPQLEGCVAVFPVRDDGTEMLWGVTPSSCKQLLEKGYLKASSYDKNKPQQFVIKYLMGGTVKDIEEGRIIVTGKNEDGSIIAKNIESRKTAPRTQWDLGTHDAMDYGTRIIKSIFNDFRFDFPKSVYAVYDAMRLFVSSKPNALIVDFFAGSGTTLHAVNLLNAADKGKRRCIMVTNNEVSVDEAKYLTGQGLKPGDLNWDNRGIARFVTWPRTKCSILGKNVNGGMLVGDYGAEKDVYIPDEEATLISKLTGKPLRKVVYTKKKMPVYSDLNGMKMSDGFKANAAFFKLSFLDKNAIALGRQFKELLPVLWMKGGAIGRCPALEGDQLPGMLILPRNKMSVLLDEMDYAGFAAEMAKHPEIQTVFIVTDSEAAYKAMIRDYADKDCYQLYRDYLDNFRINMGR